MQLSIAQIGIGSVFSVLTFIFGGWDILIQYLLLFMIFDYLTGMARATLRKEITPRKGFIGLAKKIGILMIVAIAHGLDQLFLTMESNIFGVELPIIRTFVIWGYMINEMTSILKNIKLLGVPLPSILQTVLSILQEDERVSLNNEEKSIESKE